MFISFRVNAAALPGSPPPQQHILAPDPPAPQESIVTAPFPGATKQKPLHIFVYI
jgi:hypothetical protein